MTKRVLREINERLQDVMFVSPLFYYYFFIIFFPSKLAANAFPSFSSTSLFLPLSFSQLFS